MQIFDKKTAQVLFTALVFALVLLFLYSAWRAILAFVFAVFFAYLLEAPVTKLQTWLRGSRVAAIGVVYMVFAAVLIVVLSFLGPPVAQEAQKLAQQAPEWANRITSRQIAEQVGEHYGWSGSTINRVGGFLDEYRPQIINTTENFDGKLTGQSGVNERFNAVLVDRYGSFFPMNPRDAFFIPDPTDFAFDSSLNAHSLVESILLADRHAKKGLGSYTDEYYDRFYNLTAAALIRQLSDASTDVGSYWLTAWINAGKPPLPH